MPSEKKKYYQIASLEKGINILELMADKKALTVTEVASSLNINRAGSHRMNADYYLSERTHAVEEEIDSIARGVPDLSMSSWIEKRRNQQWHFSTKRNILTAFGAPKRA